MPIDEPRSVAQLDNNIQKSSTKKTAPEEDFSKLLEKSRLPVHTVEKGDNLWNIVKERMYLTLRKESPTLKLLIMYRR